MKYFRKEWIKSSHNEWYEGVALHVPAQDNGLEGKNGSIKGIHTLRERMAVNVYLSNAVNMLRNWSLDSETSNKFNETFKCNNKTWELAFLYLSDDEKSDEDKALIKRVNKTDNYIMSKRGTRIDNNYIARRYERFDDFDELINCMKSLPVVTLKRESWTDSYCTCSYNLKNYFCYHVIALAANEGLVVIDNVHKKRAIGQKPSAGRKKKAKRALERQ